MRKVTTEEELAEAIKQNESCIEIEGSLATKTLKIKAAGNVAWAVAIGSIAICFYAVVASIGTGGAALPAVSGASLAASGAAVSVLGTASTISAISLAVSAGGLAVLKKLRNGYTITKLSEKSVLLTKKV